MIKFKFHWLVVLFMGNKLRVGVIGTGAWGKNHARVYSELPNVELVGVCDLKKENANHIASTFGVKAYYDVDDFLDNANLDLISICTPTTTHYEIGMKAIERNINVLVEKPVTTTVEQAINLKNAADKKGVKLTVGFIERFNPVVQKIKEFKESGEVGDYVTINTMRIGPFWPERLWDVGVVKDSAIHDVDAIRHIIGRNPKTVYATGGALKHKYEDHIFAILDFDEQLKATIEANFLTPYKLRKINVTGVNGIIEGDYMTQELKIETNDWIKKSKTKWKEPLKAELQAFVNAVINDEPPVVSGTDGIEVLKICEAILTSIKTGQPVKIS